MPFKRSSKPIVFHGRWMIVKVSPDAGTEIMPGYRLMVTMYYNRELMFSCQVIKSKHIETFRNIIRQLVNGRL